MTRPITRRGLAAFATLATAALLAPRAARAAPRQLRIGYQKNGSLVILRRQGTLEALLGPGGTTVQWVEFTAGPPMLEALNAGAIDFGATGDMPPIFAQAAGADLVYVGAQPIRGVSSAILVPRDAPIQSLADLKGKRVAFTKGSSAHHVVIKALDRAGLKPSDIQPINLQPSDAAAAFRTRGIDAWSIWDPFYAIAELDPGTRVLTTAEGLAPTSYFFLARRAFAAAEPGTVSALLDAINGAARWAASHPDELAALMAEVTGVPLPAQQLAAPRGVYVVQPVDEEVIARQQGIADTFHRLRVIPTRVDVRAAVWSPAA